jgi:flagellar basal-body rod modification protein FlgD
LGKQDFLKLLITQLQNQDPLNPDNPTQFTAQLAQFSSLEQMYNLNDSMNSLVSSTDKSTNMSALNLMGKQVTYAGSSFNYSGNPVQLGYTLDSTSSAAQVQLLIQDSSGNTIRVLDGTDLKAGNHFITWDGLDQNGNAVDSGDYTVTVQAVGQDGSTAAASPIVSSEVTGVDLSNSSGVVLNTQSGDVDYSKILGVSSSGTSSNQDTASTDSQSSLSALESALASANTQNTSS